MRADKASSSHKAGAADDPGRGPRRAGLWVAAGLVLTLLALSVPAWRVATLLTGRADIASLTHAHGLRAMAPGAVKASGFGVDGITLELGNVIFEGATGATARLTARSGRLTLPWSRAAFGLDGTVALTLDQARMEADDPAALSGILANAGNGSARVVLVDATWPALDLVDIGASMEPSGALRGQGDRVALDGSRSRWTLALGTPGPDGVRSLALEGGGGGTLEGVTLTGGLSEDGAAASGRLEARADAWRLQGGTWSWMASDGLTAEGTLVGPAGAAALRLNLPDRPLTDRRARLEMTFGRLDLAALGLAPDRFPGGAAILPDFATFAVSLRADLLAFGAEPVGRDLTLAGAVTQGRLLVDAAALALPLGGRVAYRRSPNAQAQVLEGRLDLDSPAASRELEAYWPRWLPAPPDGAAQITADWLAVGPDGLAVEGLGWSVSGLPDGRIDAAEYKPGATLRLRAALPSVAVAPERVQAVIEALSGTAPDIPPRLDVELRIDAARVGQVVAAGLALSAQRQDAAAPLRIVARATDLSGATLDLSLVAEPTTLGLSGELGIAVGDPARWAILAGLVGRAELARLRQTSVRLDPAPDGTGLSGRVVLSDPALELTLDGLVAPGGAAISGKVTISGPDGMRITARFVRDPGGMEVTDLVGVWRGARLEGGARLLCPDSGAAPEADITLRLRGEAPAMSLAWPLLVADAMQGDRLRPVLPCQPALAMGMLSAGRVALGPMGGAEDIDFTWGIEDERLRISAGRLSILGGDVEFAGEAPLRPGLPSGQAWATLSGLSVAGLQPDSWREDVALHGGLDGDVVLEIPGVDVFGPAPGAPEEMLKALGGEARLIWSGARVAPRLDPDGLGRLANARALAGHLEALFRDRPNLEIDLAMQGGVLSGGGVRWNGEATGSPLDLSGTLVLTTPMRLDLMALLNRPGFPPPYLRISANGRPDAPRVRVDGSWLQPR